MKLNSSLVLAVAVSLLSPISFLFLKKGEFVAFLNIQTLLLGFTTMFSPVFAAYFSYQLQNFFGAFLIFANTSWLLFIFIVTA